MAVDLQQLQNIITCRAKSTPLSARSKTYSSSGMSTSATCLSTRRCGSYWRPSSRPGHG